MNWFEKYKWSRRQAERAREAPAAPAEGLSVREALAASVEKLTASAEAKRDVRDEEEDEGGHARVSGATLIPPRLRLRSRPLPAVRVDTTQHLLVKREELAAQGDASTQEPGRRLGRSTKVRLQAVRPGQVREPITELVPSVEAEQRELESGALSTHNRQTLTRRAESPVGASFVPQQPVRTRQTEPSIPAETLPGLAEAPSVEGALVVPPSSLFCGSGMVEAGQEDATVRNARVTEQSVVTVMLASNPGPVVVHYVSLQPRAGFTLHMSAPVTTQTPFNYAVWLF
jgi:hypothetical protein